MHDNMIPLTSSKASSNAGAASASAPFFDFFGLPRELRNMVYDQPCLYDTHLCREPNYADFKVTARKPNIAMFLVSHQVSREYRESDQARVTIMAEDSHKVVVFRSPIGSIPASRVDHLEARLVVLEELEVDFDMHLKWIADWSTKATSLRSIKVDVYADSRANADTYAIGAGVASFFSHAIRSTNKLHHLRVFFSPDAYHICPIPLETGRKRFLLLEWSLGDDPDLACLQSAIESDDPRDQSRTRQSLFLDEESLADGQGVMVGDYEIETEDEVSDSDSEDDHK